MPFPLTPSSALAPAPDKLAGAAPSTRGATSQPRMRAPSPVAPQLVWLGHGFVWLTVFLSFFVLREPAPYELVGVGVIGTAFLFGLTLPRAVLPMLGLLILYVLGGFIGVTIAPNLGEARFQILVTAFLASTSLFFACYTAKDSVRRISMIRDAWQCGAILAAIFGIVGYFNVAGTASIFTIYGRAKGTFEDPNVFGPYLTGAVVFAYYSIISTPVRKWLFPIIVLGICTLGILLSFSRGSWGYTFLGLSVVTVLHFMLTPKPAERLRILALVVAGMALMAVGIIIALSVPAISDVFAIRANLIQDYDGGNLGRFGRHALGFAIAIEHPFGLGAFGFREIFGIDPHNVYLNALMAHGWMGFFAYFTLVAMTLLQLLRVVLYQPQLRAVAVPLFALFLGIMLMGTFIDTDRWRHFFLLLGLSWGVIASAVHHPYQGRG